MADPVLKFPPEQKGSPASQRPKLAAEPRRRLLAAMRRYRRVLLLVVLPLVALIAGVTFYLNGGRYVTTDDAYVGAQKVLITPDVSGKIINVASIAGLAGNSADMSMVAYNTSKAAVINFTRTLAGEWGKYNINVNALAPGMFPSKMTKGTFDRIGAEALASHAPLRRVGDDDDLKGATLLFASQAGKHITGQVLPIDGGVSAIISA